MAQLAITQGCHLVQPLFTFPRPLHFPNYHSLKQWDTLCWLDISKKGCNKVYVHTYEVKMNTNNLCSLSRLQKKKKNISAFEGLKQKKGKSAVAWCGRGGFGAMEILPQHAASRRRGHQSFLCWEEARGRSSSSSSELPPQQRPRPAREVPGLPAASHGMSTR